MPTILILGHANNAHVAHLQEVLVSEKCRVFVLDTLLYPHSFTLAWCPHQNSGSVCVDGQRIIFSEIDAVYWNHISPPNSTSVQQTNDMSMLQTWLSEPSIHWVNSWQAFQLHKMKGRQLALAEQLGARIPATYMGSLDHHAEKFVTQHRDLIIKPIHGGEYTKMFGIHELSELNNRQHPATLQKFIKGTNARTYVIGEQSYSAYIDSNEVDFRTSNTLNVTPFSLPRDIHQLAVRIMRALHMQWTAIDWRINEYGQYVFLEANPAPMFMQFERLSGHPITEKLLHLLLKKSSSHGDL